MINIEIKQSERITGELSCFLSFPYDNELITIVRNQPTRWWNSDSKTWELPVRALPSLVEQFGNRTITITGDFTPKAENVQTPLNFQFKTKPFDHQLDGFNYGLKNDRFLLGDEQGLGKTKQAIDIACAKKQTRKYNHCLIICGVNGLKWNWKAEIKTHSNESGYILGERRMKNGKMKTASNADKLADLNNLPKDFFLITNVESLRDEKICKKVQQLCKDKMINMLVIDEIHKCKNPSAQQGKAILKLSAESMIAMTGTPLMNNPLDLFITLKWLGFEKNAFFSFRKHYCVMGGYGGYEIVAYRNMSELHAVLDEIMLRRLKKEVLDLPEKISTTEYVEMTPAQTKIYNEVEAALREDIDKIKLSPNPLAQLIRLRQATGYTGILSSAIQESAKLDRMEEIVEELTDNGEKAIIFSNWTDMTTPVFERLRKYNPAVITGDVKDRSAEQEKFMKDPSCKIIIGTIGAMGTGLTLTAANTVIFLDSPWNRALKEQAEDRAHRIGTTSTVNIITIVCKDTLDERIEEIINKKGKMADMLVDGLVGGSKGEVIDYLLS